jgi:hypothetical protein
LIAYLQRIGTDLYATPESESGAKAVTVIADPSIPDPAVERPGNLKAETKQD